MTNGSMVFAENDLDLENSQRNKQPFRGPRYFISTSPIPLSSEMSYSV